MIILNLFIFGTITSIVSYIIYKISQKYKNKSNEISLPYHGYKFCEAKDLKTELSSDSGDEDLFINP